MISFRNFDRTAGVARAAEVALECTKGCVGYAPFNRASGSTNYGVGTIIIVPMSFAAAGIERIRISQTSSTNSFEQGNVYEVAIKIYYMSGRKKALTMSVNYRLGNT